MRMKLIIVAALSVVLSGCATQTFQVNGGGGSTPTQEVMQPFFVGGIGQEQQMNAAEVCGGADKVAKVETQTSILNGLLGGFTWGIFTPRQAKVYCTG